MEKPPEEWSEALGGAFRLVPGALSEDTPTGTLSSTALGPLMAYRLSGTPQMVRRAARQDSGDVLLAAIPLRGGGTLCQVDSEVSLAPGQMVLGDGGGLLAAWLDRPWTFAMLAFERGALSLPSQILQRSMRRVVTIDDGPGAVLSGFVTSAIRQGPVTRATAARLGEAGLHLLAGTLGAKGPDNDDAAADAQRIRALEYARTHLSDPRLTHDRIAAALHMSARTLHRLFADEPQTVTEYIRQHRLEAARRDLTDPLFGHRSIAVVAARWGFPSQAHFTRAFQSRYGVTPSALRRGEAA